MKKIKNKKLTPEERLERALNTVKKLHLGDRERRDRLINLKIKVRIFFDEFYSKDERKTTFKAET